MTIEHRITDIPEVETEVAQNKRCNKGGKCSLNEGRTEST